MGISAVQHKSKILIKKKYHNEILEIYSDDCQKGARESIQELFADFGFAIGFSLSGDVNKIHFEREKAGEEEELLDALSPYTKKGSFVEIIYESDSSKLKSTEDLLVSFRFNGDELTIQEYAISLDEGDREISRRELDEDYGDIELESYRKENTDKFASSKYADIYESLIVKTSGEANTIASSVDRACVCGIKISNLLERLKKDLKGDSYEEYMHESNGLVIALAACDEPSLEISFSDGWEGESKIDFNGISERMNSLGLLDSYFSHKSDAMLSKHYKYKWKWSWMEGGVVAQMCISKRGTLDQFSNIEIKYRYHKDEVLNNDIHPSEILSKYFVNSNALFGCEWIELYERCVSLAEGGDEKSMHTLYRMHISGDGCPRDLNLAENWILKAAASGDANAQYQAGIEYKDGRLFSKDIEKAKEYFTLSAESGHLQAEKALNKISAQ